MKVLGVSLAFRRASAVVADCSTSPPAVIRQAIIDRSMGDGPAELLGRILDRMGDLRGVGPASVALSVGDLACAGTWRVPEGVRQKALAKMVPGICESHSSGEVLESLAVDFIRSGSLVHAVALPERVLRDLRAQLEARRLRSGILTSVPMALAAAWGVATPWSISSGGETVELYRDGEDLRWRSFPTGSPDESATGGTPALPVPVPIAASFAVATIPRGLVPDLGGDWRRLQASRFERYGTELLNAMLAASLLLGAVGFRFQKRLDAAREGLEAVRGGERRLWAQLFPDAAPWEGGLLKALGTRQGGSAPSDSAASPSGLQFWAELATQLPDPDRIGLTLESLEIGPGGGRLAGRVPTAPEDSLATAALLERDINRSRTIQAHGDYEVRDGQVQVRLRLERKP